MELSLIGSALQGRIRERVLRLELRRVAGETRAEQVRRPLSRDRRDAAEDFQQPIEEAGGRQLRLHRQVDLHALLQGELQADGGQEASSARRPLHRRRAGRAVGAGRLKGLRLQVGVSLWNGTLFSITFSVAIAIDTNVPRTANIGKCMLSTKKTLLLAVRNATCYVEQSDDADERKK